MWLNAKHRSNYRRETKPQLKRKTSALASKPQTCYSHQTEFRQRVQFHNHFIYLYFISFIPSLFTTPNPNNNKTHKQKIFISSLFLYVSSTILTLSQSSSSSPFVSSIQPNESTRNQPISYRSKRPSWSGSR